MKRPEARLLTGHSSGGWSSLWLQLTNPDFFGGCWSSSPDPVDFSAFQVSDLYADANLYTDKDGEERGSFRRAVGPMEKVLMTAREEMGMERAIDPNGGSGQQWDAWFAMFSPPDERTGMPRRLADPETGVIDHALVNESWSGYDIARLIERRWGKLGPVLNDKVHLVVGSADSFYLERAVKRLKAKIDVLRGEICEAQPLARRQRLHRGAARRHARHGRHDRAWAFFAGYEAPSAEGRPGGLTGARRLFDAPIRIAA